MKKFILLKEMRALLSYTFPTMIVLVGASASGKTEIAKCLYRLYGVKKAVTHTSRAPREGEVAGVDYHFVSPEDFLALKKRGAFVETTCYNGNLYGCSKSEIGDGKVVIVDPKGLKAFLALHNPYVVTFYLQSQEATRRARMQGRGDRQESIEERLENDRQAFAEQEIAPTDFTISTDTKPVTLLSEQIYRLYKEKLRENGLNK